MPIGPGFQAGIRREVHAPADRNAFNPYCKNPIARAQHRFAHAIYLPHRLSGLRCRLARQFYAPACPASRNKRPGQPFTLRALGLSQKLPPAFSSVRPFRPSTAVVSLEPVHQGCFVAFSALLHPLPRNLGAGPLHSLPCRGDGLNIWRACVPPSASLSFIFVASGR